MYDMASIYFYIQRMEFLIPALLRIVAGIVWFIHLFYKKMNINRLVLASSLIEASITVITIAAMAATPFGLSVLAIVKDRQWSSTPRYGAADIWFGGYITVQVRLI
jgi:hypothetical protein